MVQAFEYYCHRDFPYECRNRFKSETKLPDNTVRCPACRSSRITFTKIEVREKDTAHR